MCKALAEGGQRCDGRHLTLTDHANRAERRRERDRARKAHQRTEAKAPNSPEQEVSVSLNPPNEVSVTLVPQSVVVAVAGDSEPRFFKHPRFGWLVVAPDTGQDLGDTELVRRVNGDIGEFRIAAIIERATVNGKRVVVFNNEPMWCEWCTHFRRRDDAGFPIFGAAESMHKDKPCCAACREVVRRGRAVHPLMAKLGLTGHDAESVVSAAIGAGLTDEEIAAAIDDVVSSGAARPRWMNAHLY